MPSYRPPPVPPHVPAGRPRLVRRPAAYTPGAPRPICPGCWSRPDVQWARGDGGPLRAPRGWAVARAAEPAVVDGAAVPVTVSVYRCANPDCRVAIELAALVGTGYVPALVAEHQLAEADAARFLAGRHTRDGVWLDAHAEPRTMPEQRELF